MRRMIPAAAVLIAAAVFAVTGCTTVVDGAPSGAPPSGGGATSGGAATTAGKPEGRAAILQAARVFVVDFLTTDPSAVDAQIAKLRAETTGKLGALYSAPNALDNARQSAAQVPVRSSVEVRTVALESSQGDTSTVLVSAAITAILPVIPGVIDKPETQRSLDRTRVTVQRQNGAQLISDFQEWSVVDKEPAPATLAPGEGVDADLREIARQYLQVGFSFTPTTFDADRAKGRALLTPNAQVVYDGETQAAQADVQYGGRSTTATPLAVGTVSSTDGKAVVLGFVNTTSAFAKGGNGPGPEQPSTWLVDLVQSGGHWLVDKYTEVKQPS